MFIVFAELLLSWETKEQGVASTHGGL